MNPGRIRLSRALLPAALVLAAALSAPAARGQEKKAPGKTAPKPSPKERIRFERDGSFEFEGRIVKYWQVNHGDPADLIREISKYVIEKRGNRPDVILEKKTQNIMRIEAPAAKWPIIEKLLEVVDIPQPQVFVEAKIIEIKYDSNLEFGFEGSYDRRKATNAAQPFFGKFTGAFNPESYLESLGTKIPFQGTTFEFVNDAGSIAKRGEYSYILRALQERGSAEILSQPSILAVQGQKATITTGLRFPVQSVDVRGNTTIVVTKFQETGIKLDITPKLVGRDYVTMDIHAEDSQVTERVPGPQGSLNPVISTRSAQTQVNVRDGETIIIGGLLSSSTIESKRGIPLLMDIPVLSYLFSANRTQEVKSELVFFITPRIIKRREHTVILPPGERRRMGK